MVSAQRLTFGSVLCGHLILFAGAMTVAVPESTSFPLLVAAARFRQQQYCFSGRFSLSNGDSIARRYRLEKP
jgi:hypothetical protein